MRRLTLTALVLALTVGAVAFALRSGDVPRQGAQPREPVSATDEVIDLRAPARELPDEAHRTRLTEPIADAFDGPRLCPDIERLVAEQADSLRERSRSLERDWVGDCLTRAADLDEHCVGALLSMGIDPARDRVERLTALSLAAADAGRAPAAALDPATSAWLWAQLAVRPFLEPDWRPDPVGEDCARVAALCLVWQGGPAVRAQLTDALSEDSTATAAGFGLARARDDDVAEPLVAALEQGGRQRTAVLSLLATSREWRAFEFTPQQTERAVRAMLDGAGGDSVFFCGTGRTADSPPIDHARLNLALSAIDPRSVAEHWSEHIDAGRFTPDAARWAVPALSSRGEAGDLQRIERLATVGSEQQRVEVSLQLLECTRADRAHPALRATCLDQLLEAARGGGSATLHQRALRALERAPDLGAREGEVQALLEVPAPGAPGVLGLNSLGG